MRSFAGALALVLAASAAGATTPERVERVVVADAAGDLVAIAPDGAREPLTGVAAGDSEPAVSFDGRRVAFVRRGAVHVLDLWTKRTVRVAAGAGPAWSPDGRLSYAAGDGVRIGNEVVAPGASEPAWSRDGRLATVTAAGVVVDRKVVGPGGRSPAWAPDGRLAYATGEGIHVGGTLVVPGGTDPAWSPDGARIAFARDGALWTASADGGDVRPLAGAAAGDTGPAWARLAREKPPEPEPKPDPNELLPDLDQRAPSRLAVAGSGRRFVLGFTSATDNVGRGPLWVRGRRAHRNQTVMRASQLVRLRDGRTRAVENVGVLRFVNDPPHYHWHFMRFQTFELRRAADFSLVVRDRKTGFCFADHYGLARARVSRFTGPRFFGNCGQHRRDLLAVEMGTSAGYTDRYPAHFHGQNVDVTGVPAGIYVLVHRANHRGRIRELRYDNNAASVRIRLTWPDGRSSPPRVRVLRTCQATERC